ncbi:MAG: hypothetical protein ACOZAO_02085 [Patescibacteria group bacterium]
MVNSKIVVFHGNNSKFWLRVDQAVNAGTKLNTALAKASGVFYGQIPPNIEVVRKDAHPHVFLHEHVNGQAKAPKDAVGKPHDMWFFKCK